VAALVLRVGGAPAAIGAAVGVAAAAAAGRLLASALYGVAPLDAPAFVGSLGVIAAVTVAAALVPARRALRIQPSRALRSD
jgi:ABC-type antimicrobial peptide transport system permease subunit